MKRLGRTLWKVKAGLYRPEYFRYRWHKRTNGCAYPERTYVIRPNGAVSPCIFWDQDPLGFLPDQSGEIIDRKISELGEGLRCGKPQGTCKTCTVRRDAFYQPLRPADAPIADSAPELG